jgi:ABC-type phosphate transport system substrate-binding protein
MRSLTTYAIVSGLILLMPKPSVDTAAAAEETEFRVVVHPSNPVETMTRQEVSDIFLKKTTKWPDGSTIQPVDLGDRSPVRDKFSRWAHGKAAAAVAAYWQQQIFSGRGTPPTQKRDDDEVLVHVRGSAHAIGYVSSAASSSGVKVVKLAN